MTSSYNMSTSSESENEIRNTKFDIDMNFNKLSSSYKTSLASNVSRKTSKHSLRYYNNLRKNNSHKSETQHKNAYFTRSKSYSLKPLKTKHNLMDLKIAPKFNQNKGTKNKKVTTSNITNLSKTLAKAFESSSDSDFSDIKYLKFISTNKEINTSPASKVSKQNNFYLNEKELTINNLNNNKENIKLLESSMSSNSFNFSYNNIEPINSKKHDYNNELNVDDLLSDCSLSDVLIVRKDDGDRNSRLYPTPGADISFTRIQSESPKSLTFNNSFEVNDNLLLQKTTNFTIDVPELIDSDINDEQNKITTNTNKQENISNNENSIINESKTFSNEGDSNKLKARSNSYKSNEESIKSRSNCKYCNHSSSNDKKLSKSKRSHKNISTVSSDVVRIKKSPQTKKIKNRHSSNKTENEDIGLEYDTNKDNFMVELPNGAIVPAFLSTLKPKYVKQLCACGISSSEIPLSWSESFHDILHQNIYKLYFKGSLPENNTINIKNNNVCYKILISYTSNCSDENIQKSIKNVDDFVSLEYGISKTNIQSYKYVTCLAILPNFKVIGYLEVESIQKAYMLSHDEQLSENIIPVKFGISKLWVLIKYKNKNVDTNLLEFFCKRENLQKEDLAFSLYGYQEVQIIQEFIGNKNILIYNENQI